MKHSLAALVTAALICIGASRARAQEDYSIYNDKWNGLSTLAAIAQGMGLDVEATTSIDWGEVGPSDVVIVLYPTNQLDPANLGEFVQQGGRLLLGDDFGLGDLALLHLGMTRGDGVGVDAVRFHNERLFAPVARAWEPEHALAQGVSELTTNHPAILPRVEGPSVVFGFGKGEAVVAAGELGAGRFVVTSDPSILINRMLQFDGNFTFAINLLRFLGIEGQTRRLVILTGDFTLRGHPVAPGTNTGVAGAITGLLKSFDEWLRVVNLYLMPREALRVLGGLLAVLVVVLGALTLPLRRLQLLDGSWTKARGGPAYLDSVESIVGYFDRNDVRHNYTLPACVLRDSLNTRLAQELAVADPIYALEPTQLCKRVAEVCGKAAAAALEPIAYRLRQLPTRAQAVSPLTAAALSERDFLRLHDAAAQLYRSLGVG